MREALDATATPSFWLEGQKLRGGYTLQRTGAARSRSGC